MPTLRIQSNAPVANDTWDALITAASAKVAEVLGKPESYVMVIAEPTPRMSFGGGREPLTYMELKRLGLPEEGPRLFSRPHSNSRID